MEEIQLYNQLRLVVYPIIYDGMFTSQAMQDYFHQQYICKTQLPQYCLT